MWIHNYLKVIRFCFLNIAEYAVRSGIIFGYIFVLCGLPEKKILHAVTPDRHAYEPQKLYSVSCLLCIFLMFFFSDFFCVISSSIFSSIYQLKSFPFQTVCESNLLKVL
jgi:hypothetical protein